jgi:hypothetical protein
MSKAPPIPPDQRAGERRADIADPTKASHGVAKGAPDTAHKGRAGNLRENVAPARHVQDR